MNRTHFKKFFITGLVALLPTILTVAVIVLCFNLLNNYFGKPIGQGILKIIELAGGQGVKLFGCTIEELGKNDLFLTFAGLPIAIVITLFVGVLLASFVGKRILLFLESLLENLPVIKVIYPYAKQFTDFLKPASQKKSDFKKVVAVEYPRKGMYAIGFVTSDGIPCLNQKLGKRYVSVFIPSSPAPFTGFLYYAAEDEIIDLPMTVDDALPLLISAGVINPPLNPNCK